MSAPEIGAIKMEIKWSPSPRGRRVMGQRRHMPSDQSFLNARQQALSRCHLTEYPEVADEYITSRKGSMRARLPTFYVTN